MSNIHLAVFTPEYIDYILDGSKTIESRFSKVKCAPYEKVEDGDCILMKESSGPVRGWFYVKDVEFHELDPITCINLSLQYHGRIFPHTDDDEFYMDRWFSCSYATIIHVRDVLEFPDPQLVNKKDRRAWVVLDMDSELGKGWEHYGSLQ